MKKHYNSTLQGMSSEFPSTRELHVQRMWETNIKLGGPLRWKRNQKVQSTKNALFSSLRLRTSTQISTQIQLTSSQPWNWSDLNPIETSTFTGTGVTIPATHNSYNSNPIDSSFIMTTEGTKLIFHNNNHHLQRQLEEPEVIFHNNNHSQRHFASACVPVHQAGQNIHKHS